MDPICAPRSGVSTLGISTVHRALQHADEIGAVQVRGSGGLRVLDPERLLMTWAGRRRLSRDTVGRYRFAGPATELEQAVRNPDAVLGGFGAVVARLGGNTIADYSTVLIYGDPEFDPRSATSTGPGSTDVIVLDPDPLLARYGRTTPLAQSWVDLFNLPGWQSARFVHHLMPILIGDAGTGQLLPA